MNLAQIMVSGNIGQQPEIKDVNGTKVANFSIAVNENYKTKSGEKKENTHWYREKLGTAVMVQVLYLMSLRNMPSKEQLYSYRVFLLLKHMRKMVRR